MIPQQQALCLRHLKSKDTFQFRACPTTPSFSLSSPFSSSANPFTTLPQRACKRPRALSDVDYNGSGNEGRKKRRLRLYLITSRLSRPFSAPASNVRVTGRGTRRGKKNFENWCGSGRYLLRKAAILNRVRMKMDAARNFWELLSENRDRERLELKEIMAGKQKQRWNIFELPPSPLGRSNYDALDLEDNDFDMREAGDDEEIYSDFNVMVPSRDDGEDHDYDYLDKIDGISPEGLLDQPTSILPEENIVELLREKERVHDGHFVQLEGLGGDL